MSLQNLLKKISDLFHHTKAKISVVKSDVFPEHKNDSFIYRNKREIVIILVSTVVLALCTASITRHAVKSNERKKQFTPTVAQAENKESVNEEKKAVSKKKKQKVSPAREMKPGILNDDVLFLLNGAVTYPESDKEQFFADYIEMYPLNNYNVADTNLIMDEYDKIIEQSITDSCTFNFERRRK